MDKLERKLRTFIEKALEQGYYLRRYNERLDHFLGAVVDSTGGCCLLGAVIVGAGKSVNGGWYKDTAQDVLGITRDQANDLEQGFENGHIYALRAYNEMEELGFKLTQDYHI